MQVTAGARRYTQLLVDLSTVTESPCSIDLCLNNEAHFGSRLERPRDIAMETSELDQKGKPEADAKVDAQVSVSEPAQSNDDDEDVRTETVSPRPPAEASKMAEENTESTVSLIKSPQKTEQMPKPSRTTSSITIIRTPRKVSTSDAAYSPESINLRVSPTRQLSSNSENKLAQDSSPTASNLLQKRNVALKNTSPGLKETAVGVQVLRQQPNSNILHQQEKKAQKVILSTSQSVYLLSHFLKILSQPKEQVLRQSNERGQLFLRLWR